MLGVYIFFFALACLGLWCISNIETDPPERSRPLFERAGRIVFRLVAALVLAAVGVIAFTVYVAVAHSWYPPVCCSDRDCYPLPNGYVAEQPGGYLLKATGEFIPASEAANGRDEDFHICRNPAGKRLCFFKPDRGM